MTRIECLEKCVNEKENLRLTRAALRDDAVSRLSNENGELKEIDDAIAKLGAKLPLAAIAGKKSEIENIKATVTELNVRRNAILKKAGIHEEECDCDICKDTGFVNGKYCRCVKQAAAKMLIEELSKSAPVEECRFENFDLTATILVLLLLILYLPFLSLVEYLS